MKKKSSWLNVPLCYQYVKFVHSTKPHNVTSSMKSRPLLFSFYDLRKSRSTAKVKVTYHIYMRMSDLSLVMSCTLSFVQESDSSQPHQAPCNGTACSDACGRCPHWWSDQHPGELPCLSLLFAILEWQQHFKMRETHYSEQPPKSSEKRLMLYVTYPGPCWSDEVAYCKDSSCTLCPRSCLWLVRWCHSRELSRHVLVLADSPYPKHGWSAISNKHFSHVSHLATLRFTVQGLPDALPYSGFLEDVQQLDQLTMTLYSICCLMSLSSLSEYLASLVSASTGPLSTCCLMALNSMYRGSPAHS